MEFLIPIRDIVIEPGKRLDPSATSEGEAIALIKKELTEKGTVH